MEGPAKSTLQKVEQALPEEFVDRLKKQLHPHEYDAALESFEFQKPVTIRPNTLRATEDEVLQQVHSAGMHTEPVAWCPQCHLLTTGTIRGLQELPIAESGGMYIQAASSMLAVHALQVEPEMRVLDMCAAPGSKTSQIAAMMQNQGMLVANDRSRKRLYRLREILQVQGATNVEVLCGPGERLGQSHADCFDRVLVDAPCSGEGRFRIDKPIRLSRWSMHEIQSLAKLQEQLLVAALRCVCVGGMVVYSTCTFAPEENECVLEKVLSRNSIDAKVVQIPEHLRPPTTTDPVTHWNGKQLKENIRESIRIIPNSTTTGFFIACLQRIS
jgi:16S rRNA (cytosine1407-C5)-methyltransferase